LLTGHSAASFFNTARTDADVGPDLRRDDGLFVCLQQVAFVHAADSGPKDRLVRVKNNWQLEQRGTVPSLNDGLWEQRKDDIGGCLSYS
jgi:hypothetical protein